MVAVGEAEPVERVGLALTIRCSSRERLPRNQLGVASGAVCGAGIAVSTAGATVWQVTRTTRYAADCLGPCVPGALVNPQQAVSQLNVPLTAPGTTFSDRIKQLDLTFGKWIQAKRMRIQPEVSIFNALNNNAAYAVRSLNYLTSSYLQPSMVLQPRIVRLGLQIKW